MKVRYTIFIVAVLLFFSPRLPIHALYVESDSEGFVLDLPIGWEEAGEASDSEGMDSVDMQAAEDLLPDGVSGDDITSRGFVRDDLEAWLFTASKDALDPDTLMDAVAEAVAADGDAAYFQYNGNDAFFADVTRENGHSGYMMSIEFSGNAGVLFVTAPEDQRDGADQELLSVADAFAPRRPTAGPVSSFFEGDNRARESVDIRFPGPDARDDYPSGEVEFATGQMAADTGEMLVSREAGILAEYEFEESSAGDGSQLAPAGDEDPEWIRAWRRYFRLIYRDSYQRIENLSDDIEAYIEDNDVPEAARADLVLSWLQAFEFHQVDNAGRFQPPVASLLSANGDCDSLAMIYAIILDHLGIEAQMLVSVEHGHGVAIVSADDADPGQGDAQGSPQGVETSGEATQTQFELEGETYLPAEMTTAWPLGEIAGDQVDASGWYLMPVSGLQ